MGRFHDEAMSDPEKYRIFEREVKEAIKSGELHFTVGPQAEVGGAGDAFTVDKQKYKIVFEDECETTVKIRFIPKEEKEEN